MSYSEDKFKDHVQAVMQSTEYDSNRALTLSELKELALSMGLSETEWTELLKKAESSLVMALAHMKVENYTDAIQSAEEATAINPYIKDGNAILAQCYLKLANVEKNQDLFIKAEHYARMELTNDPLDSVALNVISAVESQKQEQKSSTTNIKKVGIIGAGILAVFLVLYTCSRTNKETVQPTTTINSNTGVSIEAITSKVESTRSIYHAAIQRRNDLALELLGVIHSQKIKDNLKSSIVDYSLSDIATSERNFKLAFGEAKSADYFTDSDLVSMEGQTNRIATAKKRYLVEAANYNAFLKEHPEYQSNYESISYEE